VKRIAIIFICLWCAGLSLAAIIGPGRVQRRVVAVAAAPANNYCLAFDNNDDAVRIKATAQTLVTTALTWSIWHKFNTKSADWDMLISAIDTSTYSIYPDVDNNKHYRVTLRDGIVDKGIHPIEGQWIHFAVTYDKPKQSVIAYTNGAIAFTGVVNVTLSVDANYGWCVGNYANGGGYCMDGKLDEPAMWNRALTREEILLIWTNGPPGAYPNTNNPPWNTGLAFAFHLNDGAGTNAVNFAPGAVGGGLENGPIWTNSEVALQP